MVQETGCSGSVEYLGETAIYGVSLTLRELVFLQWPVRGKSAWEIGCIPGSSGARPRSISIPSAEKPA
ncbi:hypothetical protein [Mesorhizobium tianshanense]|nr:hypothetical protein [Mesorhizobium tianshanense]